MSSSGFGSHNGLTVEDNALIAIGAGKVPGVKGANLQAQIPALVLAGQDLIRWGTTYVWPSDSGEAMTLVSTVAGDTSPIAVVGLDIDFKEQVRIVALTGTTPVAVPGTWTRINLLDVVGPVRTTGIVTINGNGNTYGRIEPTFQMSDMGVYTSPAGKNAQILSVFSSIVRESGNSDSSVEVSISFRQVGGVFKKALGFGLQRRGTSALQIDNVMPNALPGPIDNIVSAKPTTNNVSMSIRMALLTQEPNK